MCSTLQRSLWIAKSNSLGRDDITVPSDATTTRSVGSDDLGWNPTFQAPAVEVQAEVQAEEQSWGGWGGE
jgi:hypothetical protein